MYVTKRKECVESTVNVFYFGVLTDVVEVECAREYAAAGCWRRYSAVIESIPRNANKAARAKAAQVDKSRDKIQM